MSTQLPDFLVEYLAKRDAYRADAVNTLAASFTARELLLIKEAAVMGYVQGRMRPASEDQPKDRQVLVTVLDACIAMPELYPTITSYQPDSEDDDPAS